MGSRVRVRSAREEYGAKRLQMCGADSLACRSSLVSSLPAWRGRVSPPLLGALGLPRRISADPARSRGEEGLVPFVRERSRTMTEDAPPGILRPMASGGTGCASRKGAGSGSATPRAELPQEPLIGEPSHNERPEDAVPVVQHARTGGVERPAAVVPPAAEGRSAVTPPRASSQPGQFSAAHTTG